MLGATPTTVSDSRASGLTMISTWPFVRSTVIGPAIWPVGSRTMTWNGASGAGRPREAPLGIGLGSAGVSGDGDGGASHAVLRPFVDDPAGKGLLLRERERW